MSKQSMTIAYVTQTFPALTQTFVYRETLALEGKGFDIMTCAIWKPDKDSLSRESRHLVDRSFYVFPISWFRFFMAHLYFLLTRPIKYIGTLLFVLTRKGERGKNRLRTLFHFSEAVYLALEVKKRHVVHVHAHFTINAATIALVLSRLLGISFSFTAHNIFFTDRILLKDKVQEARFIVAISEFSKQFLSRLVPGEQHKIHVVHCGLSLEDFFPDAKPENDVPLLLFVAQLAERKGAQVLVETCSILSERGVPFRCSMVGGGAEPEVLCLRQLVERHALDGAVELAGAVPQERLKQYLQRADLFVLPCITASDGDMDGIPVSLMEAMAMEIPTVSTYVSGIPELIENEQSGLLVPEKDPEALADAIQRVLRDEKLRERLGKNGRCRVQAEFNIHKNVAQLVNLFERYLKAHV
jgi:colanic acid/amylovoran biosynthesis glycosyltransferase